MTQVGRKQMVKKQLYVEGMSCNHCVDSIEKALKSMGVTAVVDLSTHLVTVEFEQNQISLSLIQELIEKQGYEVKNPILHR